MSDEILTNDEVDALLDGVESGQVEVHSATGPMYASVKPFSVPRRSHIASNSYPKLELLNESFARRLQKRTKQLLNSDLELTCTSTVGALFGDICSDHSETMAVVEFSAPPLLGNGAIVIGSSLVHQLVELFFGGSGSEPTESAVGRFTQGERRVIHSFSAIILQALKETLSAVEEITPEQQKTESSIATSNICDESSRVIMSSFEFMFGEHSASLHVLLPEAMVAALLPVFKGIDRKEDPQQDEMWADTIRASVTDVSVDLATTVGRASMTLGELICLRPGDIIDIANPSVATMHAEDIALLEGRFGVHAGHNAVEATKWLSADIQQTKKDGTHG